MKKHHFDLEEIRRLYCDDHVPVPALAKRHGCGYGTIWRFLNENGIKTNAYAMLKFHVRTEEHKKNIGLAQVGRILPEEQREMIRQGMLRAAAEGHPGCWRKGHKPTITPERNEKIRVAAFGKKRPKICKEGHYLWKGGKKPALISDRTCEKSWGSTRLAVLERDGCSCQNCGTMDGFIDVHHIIPWKETHDDSMENLTTLCRACHRREDIRIQQHG
jgi:hypothetical protein